MVRGKTRVVFYATLLGLLACGVDTDYPAGVNLTCKTSQDCPKDWTCSLALRCKRPGEPPDDAEILAQAKNNTCGMIYDKGQTCRPDILAVLGPSADQTFDASRDDFVLFCTTDLMAEATSADLPKLEMAQQFMGSLPCANFVVSLCDLYTAQSEFSDNNCPDA